jgi:molecular chaperone GrpE
VTQGPHEADNERDDGRPRVRDRRRIDPKTYEVRDPDAQTTNEAPAAAEQDQQPAGAAPEVDGLAAEIEKLKGEVADRTADLQRVQAEYVNYKRRVDRDRDLARAGGIEAVLRDLLGVLDSIKAARDHGELTGGFKGVADEIEKLAARYGLEAFGEPGDPFDPRIHEALMHAHADGITGPTAVTILQLGYKLKDRVIRPARVAVAEPEEDAAQPGGAEAGAPVAEAASGVRDTGAEEAVDAGESADQV